MSRLHPFDPNETDESIELDRLCDRCVAFFDELYTQGHRFITLPHHNMSGLVQAAAGQCRLCSLLLHQLMHNPRDGWRDDQDAIDVLSLSMVFSGDDLVLDVVDGTGMIFATLYGEASQSPRFVDARSKAVWNSTDATLLQIRKWTEQCVSHHEDCLRTQSIAATRRLLPSRLLDVTSVMTCDSVRLISTAKLSLDTQYVTLSHCWGGICAAILSTANIRAYNGGVRMSSLPQTFRDALIVTAKLGMSFLWIDALCTKQDSQEDWEHEASFIGDIYANSHLTLAATASEDSNGGLFHH